MRVLNESGSSEGEVCACARPDRYVSSLFLEPPPHRRVERPNGIEPLRPVWKTGVLPLNYVRVCQPIGVAVSGAEAGFDTDTTSPEGTCSLLNYSALVTREGF